MSGELVIQKENQSVPEVQLNTDDVKKYIAPDATDKELYLFMNIARSYGLNPFKREIHFAKYGNSPGQIIVGYETYIKRAERTGLLDGWSVWFEKDQVGEKAVIEIHRKDRNKPFKWEVYRQEFDKKQSTWKTMPYFMLKKVAISQGFRLAFPEDLGGMPYTPDEINAGTSENLPKEEVTDAEFVEPTYVEIQNLEAEIEKCSTVDELKSLYEQWRETIENAANRAEANQTFKDAKEALKEAA